MSRVQFPGLGHIEDFQNGSNGFPPMALRNYGFKGVLVPDVPHKPQGDPKPEVLSLHSALFPQTAAP